MCEPSHYEPPTHNNQVKLANTNLPLVFSHKIYDITDLPPVITTRSNSIMNLPLVIYPSISQTKSITM